MVDLLLVDDEPSIRLVVGDALRAAGHTVSIAEDGAVAQNLIAERRFDVVVTDIRLPRVDGITLFRQVRQDHSETDVILITAYGAVDDAVAALKEGALDYLTKPFDPEELVVRISRVAERHQLRRALAEARAALASRRADDELVGRSPIMQRLLDRIGTIAESDAPVLITGESGTGKELVARRLHDLSPRRTGPFVAVNCAAFPETLLEAELFGHDKGAFTGAVKKRDGRFKAAHGGTLFLDEVAEIPLMAQAKLLRVLQSGTFEPLGTNSSVKVDVRVISATHRNLRQHIVEGRFREDLYYRLNVLGVTIPPLRERRSDLPLLVEHFLRAFTPAGQGLPSISPRAWAVLSAHEFPGNVRELQHAIHHAVVLSRGHEIDLEHLPAELAGREVDESVGNGDAEGSVQPLAQAVRAFEREYLLRALKLTHGKRQQAADMLGISRKNLWEKLRAHGISDAGDPDD
jgi:DNA-binding NtrC family response regulator